MASEEAGAGAGGADTPVAAPKAKLSPQTLFVLVNMLLMLAALGMLVYTKLLYKKPEIIEETELEKKKEELGKPLPLAEKSLMAFEQVTVNIAMTQGKAHYATIAFSLELRDAEAAAIAKAKKAMIVDKMLQALAKRQVTELNTIQGKLLLKTQLMTEYNEVISPGAVTDIFFSNFILQ
jgi:flagellar FliL protein